MVIEPLKFKELSTVIVKKSSEFRIHFFFRNIPPFNPSKRKSVCTKSQDTHFEEEDIPSIPNASS